MARQRFSRIVGLLVPALLLGVTVLAGGQSQKKTEPGAQATAPAPATVDATFTIGPGDVLSIDVWKEQEITRQVPVRPDGKISLPLLGDVQAEGLTAPGLAASITEKLRKYVANPQVTVIVQAVNSQRFYVIGEVNRGGAFPLLPGMTVMQALSSAGGFTQFANMKNIYVLRTENGKQVKYPFNYKDAIKGKRLDQDIVLKSGDRIVVP